MIKLCRKSILDISAFLLLISFLLQLARIISSQLHPHEHEDKAVEYYADIFRDQQWIESANANILEREVEMNSRRLQEAKKIDHNRDRSRSRFSNRSKKHSPATTQQNIPCGISGNALASRWVPNKIDRRTRSHKRIIGGQQLNRGEFPWLVLIYTPKSDINNTDYRCVGTIIHERFVLSTKKCYTNQWTKIIAGLHDFSMRNSSVEQERQVKNRLDYQGIWFGADILLIEVSSPFNWTDDVRHVCLPSIDQTQDYDNMNVTIAGWGAVHRLDKAAKHSNDTYPSIARALVVPLANTKTCMDAIKNFRYRNQLCTSELQMTNLRVPILRGAGDQDIGGPALIYRNEHWEIIGAIKAIGFTLDTWPNIVYSKVSYYLRWIDYNLSGLPMSLYQVEDGICGINPNKAPRGFPDAPTFRSKSKSKRIIQGMDVYRGQFPWFVMVKTNDSEKAHCSGSIISRDWVLTAAHCHGFGVTHQIVAGVHDIHVRSEHEQIVDVLWAFTHPKYNSEHPKNAGYDIALVRLATPLEWTQYVRPLCLPLGDKLIHGTTVTVVGKGAYGLDYKKFDINNESTHRVSEIFPTRLQFTEAEIAKDEFCENVSYMYERSIHFCLPSRKKPPYNLIPRSSCHGDSGGPALYKRFGRWEAYGIGVSSNGQVPCFNSTSVFVLVSSFRSWINEVIL